MPHKQKIPASYPCPPGFNGRLAGMYRWFSGRPLNGHRYTDSTFIHQGTMAVDISGKASRWQLLPGYKRVLYARAPLMATAPVLSSLAMWPWPTAWGASLVATLAIPSVAKKMAVAKFNREVVDPVAMAVANVARMRFERGRGHLWMAIPRDFRENPLANVTITLPMGWIGQEGDRKQIANVVTGRLAIEDSVATWDMTGQRPVATFSVPAKPPKLVTWDMAKDIAGQGIAVGIGPSGQIVLFDLELDSPHMLIAGGSGAGKSVFLAWLVAQFMRQGYGVAVLDAKFTSHMWLRKVPGVLYASESEDLHEALLWLDSELLRRARFVADGGDPATLIPLVAVLEEMNAATNRLRQCWGSIKGTGDPMMSPAITALGNLSSMGRELRMHILMAGQSMTGKATGGPETRENFGARALARATAKQWNMLAPQIKPAPTKRNAPGRWHLVVGDTLREFQVPYVDLKGSELIAWATDREPIPDVPAMMLMGGGTTTREVENAMSEAVTPDMVSLRTYAQESGIELSRLRKWSDRQDFPMESAMGANRTRLYARDHLRAYVRTRVDID